MWWLVGGLLIVVAFLAFVVWALMTAKPIFPW